MATSSRLAVIDTLLARAVARGELPTAMSTTAMHRRMFGGALFFSMFAIDEGIDDRELASVVDLLLTGLRAA